ncbi:MAG: SDR family NAD(P)-dependent oxidoreductase [Pseudomonadales bacterium]
MQKRLCIIAGVGPGNGLAFCSKFVQAGYRVAILARNFNRMQEYAAGNENISPFSCDLSSPESIEAAFSEIVTNLGVPDVVIYNAGSGVFGAPLETSFEDFEQAWRINALGLLAVSKAVAPAMIEKGGGSFLVTGATASLRGGANFGAFSAAKAAQRNLTQSLARSLGSKGIHVALVIVDGVIDIPRTREMFKDKPDGFFLRPEAIADTFYHLSQQEKSAWTFEIDLRPSGEAW